MERKREPRKSKGDEKLVQRAFERKLKGSRRSRKKLHSDESGSDESIVPSGEHHRGSGTAAKEQGQKQGRDKHERKTPKQHRGSGGAAAQPRDSSPFIVITPPTDGAAKQTTQQHGQPQSTRPTEPASKGKDYDHLMPPTKHRRKRKHAKGPKLKTPKQIEQSLTAAVRRELRSQKDSHVQIRLTKSHAQIRARRRMNDPSGKWAKEANDWEWKDLLWKMNLKGRIYAGFADVEYRIIRMNYKYHDMLIPYMCIFLMFFLPLAIWWDYSVIYYYEVPRFTFLRHAGCLILVHFMAVLMNTYAYMMVALQNTKIKLKFILGIGMFVHPLLFFIRSYLDMMHTGFTAEWTVFYDSYKRKKEEDPVVEDYLGHSDRFSAHDQQFQSWVQFMEDREHYFRQTLED